MYLSLAESGVISEMRAPQISDLESHAGAGSAILIAARNGRATSCHSEVVLGFDGESFDIYSPQYRGLCLFRCSSRYLSASWLPSEGFVAVSR